MSAPRGVWEKTRVRVDDVIELRDAAGVVWTHQLRKEIDFGIGKVTISWTSGEEKPFVTLYTCRGGRPERLDGGRLFLDQLREVPPWLADIIERSRPRVD